jgi:hypothetical protein
MMPPRDDTTDRPTPASRSSAEGETEPRPPRAEDLTFDALLEAFAAGQLDPDDPTHGEAYAWLAAEARRAQNAAEWAATHERAQAWARRMAGWVEARRAFGAASEVLSQTAAERARAPFRTVAGLPARFDVGEGGRGLRIADACARRLSARQGAMAPALDVGVAAGAGRELWDAPVPAWVPLPGDLPDGRYFAVPVAGDSMEPMLSDGDLLLVRVDVAPVAGTVVVARHPDDGYVVKQLAAVTVDAFTLVPANPRYSALTIPRDPALVAGRVVLAWRA